MTNSPDWRFHRIELPCPSCGKKDLQLLGELISENSIDCRYCGEPIDISGEDWQAAIQKVADGLSEIYIIASK